MGAARQCRRDVVFASAVSICSRDGREKGASEALKEGA